MKIAGSTIAAIIVFALLILITGIPAGFLTPSIGNRVERDTGYRLIAAGPTRIGLWPSPHVTMGDVRLESPRDSETSSRAAFASIRAEMTLASLWSSHPKITELALDRPVFTLPLRRERQAAQRPLAAEPGSASNPTDSNIPRIEHIVVTDGTVMFSNPDDRFERRIEGIGASVAVSAEGKTTVTGDARAGRHPLKFDIEAQAPVPPMRLNGPVEFHLEIPGILQAPLSAKADVRLNGALVMINGLSGTIGDATFNGWTSLDFSGKPLVKLDLDFQRLDIAAAGQRTAADPKDADSSSQSPAPSPSQPHSQPHSQSHSQTWSDTTFELTGLNYVDAELHLSAAELNIGQAHFAPAATESTLAKGVLKCTVSNLGLYGGQANGEVGIDVSAATPAYTFRGDLLGVRALPLLRGAADFDKLDGKLQANLALRATGQSQRAIVSGLSGTASANFRDGVIQGLNVAQMIRSLISSPLSGWQESRQQATDLSQLSASFRIDKGLATTTDLNLVGPLVRMTGGGTIDLPSKMLAFRVEPKLVMTTEGQGRAADPIGFGVPVMIEGPWARPHIYLDVAGMLDDPNAAYAKLKEIGKGLFGTARQGADGSADNSSPGGGLSDLLGGIIGGTLGNLLQQGLGQGAGQAGDQGRGHGRGLPPPSPDAPQR
jgi:AsmA protein